MGHEDIKIVIEIKNYIDLHGGDYTNWFVGRAQDPWERLAEHGIDPDLDHYIFLPAPCLDDAKGIEHYFVTRLGTDGHASGNGDENGHGLHVYAFKKNLLTRP